MLGPITFCDKQVDIWREFNQSSYTSDQTYIGQWVFYVLRISNFGKACFALVSKVLGMAGGHNFNQ